jgi:hypothetical protein
MSVETRKSYCRFCHAYCALDVDVDVDVDVEQNRVVAVRGDRDNPISGMARQSAIPVRVRRVAGL